MTLVQYLLIFIYTPVFKLEVDGFLTFAINNLKLSGVGYPSNDRVVRIDNLAGLGGSKVLSPKYNRHVTREVDILFPEPYYLQSKYLYV